MELAARAAPATAGEIIARSPWTLSMTAPSGIPTNTTRRTAPSIGVPGSEASPWPRPVPHRRQRLVPHRRQQPVRHRRRQPVPRLQLHQLPVRLLPLLLPQRRHLIFRFRLFLHLSVFRAPEERQPTRSRSSLVAALVGPWTSLSPVFLPELPAALTLIRQPRAPY